MNGAPIEPPAFERTLMRLMLAGVWLSSLVLALGLALLFLTARQPQATALLRAGLLIVMATPVLRVIMSMAEAVRQRDWFWLWATGAVALILTGTVAYSLIHR